MKKSLNLSGAENCFSDIENHWAKAYILNLVERDIIQKGNDALFHPEDEVTTEQFITWVIRGSKGDIEPTGEEWSSGYIDYALQQGIIEDYDLTNMHNPIERRSAARIVHEALLTEMGEKDEEEWSAAKNLQDLYNCRTCLMHIAQVYVKGIMPGRKHNIFDLTGSLTRAEAVAIIVRMLDREERIPPRPGDVSSML